MNRVIADALRARFVHRNARSFPRCTEPHVCNRVWRILFPGTFVEPAWSMCVEIRKPDLVGAIF
eukprot:2018027-Pyramimonas_sp.AAC.1